MSIRVETKTAVVRLFPNKEAASKAVKARESTMQIACTEEQVLLGWVVKAIVSNRMFDDAGEVPEKAAQELREQFKAERRARRQS